MTGPMSVRVSAWGELSWERNEPDALRVLVAGQHAGMAFLDGGVWAAQWEDRASRRGPLRRRRGDFGSADEAVAAVARSGFARQLGATRASRIVWTEKARRRAARLERARVRAVAPR